MIFADMHCDTITELYKKVKNGSNETIRKNTLHIDLYKLKEADYLLQNFAVFINKGKSKELFKDCIRNIEFYYKEMEKNKDKVYAFGLSTGTYQEGNDKVDYTMFLVGTAKEADSLSKVAEKLKPTELLKK